MPQLVYDLLNLLAFALRFLGLAALGLGIGWLSLDLLRKAQNWQAQVALFLGLAGFVIAVLVFTSPAALGAFGLGFGAAIFLWGLPKKKKEEEEKK